VSSISLNPKQKQAVEHGAGPLLIVAGPGTGKTRVITERIRYLISEKGIDPQSILALTFTEKAAGEILARVDEAMPLGYEEPWLLTFHSFCDRILRLSGLEIGLDPDYKIMTGPEQWLFVREHLFDFDFKHFRPLGNPSKFISALLAFFSRLQDEDIGVDEFGKFAESQFVNCKSSTVKRKGQSESDGRNKMSNGQTLNYQPNAGWPLTSVQEDGEVTGLTGSEREELEKLEELAKAYETYQKLKLVESRMDFGDLISWILTLFRKRPSVLKKYQEQFQYILVDEFQDTNYAQYQLIKLLAPADNIPNLLVVGDDFQAIYKFRGAALSNILNYKNDYPEAETIVLNQDYRNPQPVLDAVRNLVKQNEPNTLESRIGIDKSLEAVKTGSNSCHSEAEGRRISVVRRSFADAQDDEKYAQDDEKYAQDDEKYAQDDGRQASGGWLSEKSISVLSCTSILEEAERVVQKIVDLIRGGEYSWRDFAVLARANSHLDPFVMAFRRAGVPYQLLGNRGLFDQPEIRELVAFLRVVADTANGPALFELMSSSVFGVDAKLAANLLASARKTRRPLWQVITEVLQDPRILCHSEPRLIGAKNPFSDRGSFANAQDDKKCTRDSLGSDDGLVRMVREVENARADILKSPPTKLLYDFITGSGFLEQFLAEDSVENQLKIKNLNLFFEKIKKFETDVSGFTRRPARRSSSGGGSLGEGGPTVPDFVAYLDLLVEAGENPAQAEIEDIDTVNLLTVHSAKGLEWPVVFLVNLVAGRFPARRRSAVLEIPEGLIKDVLPEGDAHLQEERRLFYVGCTRASERLFLTWAKDYGGKKEWKPSGFIGELGISCQLPAASGQPEGEIFGKGENLQLLLSLSGAELDTKYQILNTKYQPASVSYSQLETFKQCPLKYKYHYVLGIPALPSHTLSFGQTIHRVLRDFHRTDLFQKKELSYLLELYERHWIEEGYDSEEHKRARFAEGEKFLEAYFEEHSEKLGRPIYLEKKFTLKVGGVSVIGSIDRVDEPADGGKVPHNPEHLKRREVDIIDYKTGKVKDQRAVDKDEQLTIYALAARDALGLDPKVLSLYFIDGNVKVSTTRTDIQLDAARDSIKKTIEAIENSDFKPTPNFLCDYCDFRQICPVRKI